jgi:type I restriction enzyme S subunit
MDYVDNFLFEGLHVLVAEDGSVERDDGRPFVQLVDGKFWVNNHAHVLRAATNRDTDTRFLFYALSTIGVRPFMTGSVQPKLTQENLNRIPIPYPPEPDRRAIAHILGTLDDKIELNRRMSETLEAMARALFKAWFVDFEPVRAKMEGCWQRGQSLPGLPAHLYDLFPDRLVDSELGEIPEGWRVVELGQVIEINPHRTLRKGQCAPYLDMASMPTRGHVPLRVVERPYTSGPRFTNGDTLLARITPCLENGKTAFIDFLAPNEVGWGSTEFIVLRPKPPLPAEFGYCLARDPDFREFAIQSMTGTSGRQRVQPEALARYLLVIPSDDVAKAFGALVEPWFRKASASERESRTLAALRDALLPKLIRGEIRVKEAERFVQDFGGERG